MNDNLFKYIILSILIFNILLTFKKFKSKLDKTNQHEIKSKLIAKNEDKYKELFNLYFKDKKKFYSKGRKYISQQLGKIYNESNVITFQDKLNYLLIHESPEDKTNIVDKIQLRNYSKTILGKDICTPILKIYNDIDEINLDELPEKFVLKCNHGSGMNIFCEDKSKFNISKVKKKLKEWMNINYGLLRFEYQYLNVNRQVFAEKLLDKEIINYKFSCFNGEPKLIRVKGNFNGTNLYRIYYINWTISNIEFDDEKYVLTNMFKKPKNFDKMIKYSKLLSSRFCYCRVDFYEVNDNLYLGEITFTPFNTIIKFKKKETEIYLGNLINISRIKTNKNP